MKIYTKTGDDGSTSLFRGDRVAKDHLRIRVYGTLDELNALLGITLSLGGLEKSLEKNILKIQNELFTLGAELATPRGKEIGIELIQDSHIKALETQMDEMEKNLLPLKNFILPGGHPCSAYLHFARTVCRRAERELITLHRSETCRETVLQYLNRLSDYFFMAARFQNYSSKIKDTPWSSK